MDCIFCKIVNGEIPSYKIFEDEKNLAFLDIAPTSYGHTLVIPKIHYKNLEEIPEGELQNLAVAIKKVGALLKEKLKISGYNITENNDPIAGQIVPHIHFHIVPRYEGDGLELWPQKKLSDEQAKEILLKVRSN